MAKRIMALDVGDKWIGMAVSDETGLIAQSRPALKRHNLAEDLSALNRMVLAWQVEKIVVGLPLNMNATMGPQAKKTLRFVDKLRTSLGLPVTTWDERLTSQEAERILIARDVRREHRKQYVDGVAASLILQGYLDRERLVKRGDSDG
jgi:putative Holliday junction resolvase